MCSLLFLIFFSFMFLSLAINPLVFWDLLTWPCSQSHQISAPLNLFLIKHQLWHWPVYTLAYRSHLKGKTRDSLKDICQQTLELPSPRGRVGITSHISKVHGVGKKVKTEAYNYCFFITESQPSQQWGGRGVLEILQGFCLTQPAGSDTEQLRLPESI